MVAGYVGTVVERALVLKCSFALAAIDRRYRARYALAIEPIGDRHFRFPSDWRSMAGRPIGGRSRQSGGASHDEIVEDLDCHGCVRGHRHIGLLGGHMGFQSRHGLMYGGPGKMSAMAMAPAEKNHEAM
jgi:hypothetical protein